MSRVMKSTPMKMTDFVIRIAKTKFQFTEPSSIVLSAPKINAGNAKFPTNIPIPLDSDGVSRLNLEYYKYFEIRTNNMQYSI